MDKLKPYDVHLQYSNDDHCPNGYCLGIVRIQAASQEAADMIGYGLAWAILNGATDRGTNVSSYVEDVEDDEL